MPDLEAIQARADAATAGPWREFISDVYAIKGCGVPVCSDCREVHLAEIVADEDEADNREADAEFIAHAREDVPALIREVSRLRAENDHLRHGGSVPPPITTGATT